MADQQQKTGGDKRYTKRQLISGDASPVAVPQLDQAHSVTRQRPASCAKDFARPDHAGRDHLRLPHRAAIATASNSARRFDKSSWQTPKPKADGDAIQPAAIAAYLEGLGKRSVGSRRSVGSHRSAKLGVAALMASIMRSAPVVILPGNRSAQKKEMVGRQWHALTLSR